MINNLNDYVKITPSIPKKLCKKIITELKNIQWEEHQFVNYSGTRDLDNNVQTQKSPCQNLPENIKLENGQELMDSLHDVISNYIKTINAVCFNGWNGYTYIKFNKYNVGDLMEKHIDHIHNIFDGSKRGIPILSIIGLLDDKFKGGEIEMFNDTKIKLKAGEVLIFPSNFQYPHMVCPITKGTRHSFVSWVY